jgi:hypothetical protein
MFVEPALGYFGLSFFGHEHTRNEHPVKDGAFAHGAPITGCWNYDFPERDCDGPDDYKAFVADGAAPLIPYSVPTRATRALRPHHGPKRAPSTPTPTAGIAYRIIGTMGRPYGSTRGATWRGTRWPTAAPVPVWSTLARARIEGGVHTQRAHSAVGHGGAWWVLRGIRPPARIGWLHKM